MALPDTDGSARECAVSSVLSVTDASDIIRQHVLLKLLLLEEHFQGIADIENADRPRVRTKDRHVL